MKGSSGVSPSREEVLLGEFWRLLRGPDDALSSVSFEGPPRLVPSVFDVTAFAAASVAAATLAVADLLALVDLVELVDLVDEAPVAADFTAADAAPWLEEASTAFGPVRRVRCPGVIEGVVARWAVEAGPLGVHAPTWQARG